MYEMKAIEKEGADIKGDFCDIRMTMVAKVSTGMEAMVVTSPEIIEATKWQKIPS